MGDTDKPKKETQESAGLARDVAHLYSFAHAEDVSYRVFARTPKPRPTASPLSEAAQPPSPPPAQAEPAPGPAQAAPSEPEHKTVAAAASAHVAAPPTAPSPTLPSRPLPAPPAAHATGLPAAIQPQAANNNAIAILSIAGGVGKTTIAANLGRILSAHNEHVLLVDATWAGLLPYYFGATDMRHGMRTFYSPEPNIPPIRVLGAEHITREWLQDEVKPAMQTAQRTIFDVGPASLNLLPEILPLCSLFLIPLVVDINSIMSIPRAEAQSRFFHQANPDLPEPLYILNKLDVSSERERQGRELILREVGNRLLPISIRRSPEVTEAIAARMTIADYAPESEIVQDFTQLALWIQKAVPVAQPAAQPGRWSEA